ncbi:MAG: hypothetical protein HDS67_08360 [Bacteroidales bacterium]|nr:hypothetical protein [Bacteroidales bacterium]
MKQIKIFLFMLIGCFWLTSCGNEEDLHLSDNGLADSQPQSTVISLEEAERELISILNELYNPLTRGDEGQIRRIGNAYSRPIGNKATRSSEDEEILIHIINFEDEQGFAIMAGDIRLPSLIALAETGSLNEDEPIDNPGLEIFMDGLNDWTITRPPGWGGGSGGLLPPDVDVTPGLGEGVDVYYIYGNWENSKVYCPNGLCSVKWGQGDPYNLYTPTENSYHCVTGCVATALAQFMALNRYPNSYNGYSFDWAQMTAKPNAKDCSTSAKQNVARLMQQLGLSENLSMNYGLDSSSASGENITRTLKNFGYSKPGLRSDYNTDGVVEELKQGYAVIIEGYRINENNTYKGHEWLAHGLLERQRAVKAYAREGGYLYTKYEYQWYTLCNWGWDGSQDGYYLSGVFDTTSGPIYGDDLNSPDPDVTGGPKRNYKYLLKAQTGIRK